MEERNIDIDERKDVIDDSTNVAHRSEDHPDASYVMKEEAKISGQTIGGAGSGPSTGDPGTSAKAGTPHEINEFGVGYPEADYMNNDQVEEVNESPSGLEGDNDFAPDDVSVLVGPTTSDEGQS